MVLTLKVRMGHATSSTSTLSYTCCKPLAAVCFSSVFLYAFILMLKKTLLLLFLSFSLFLKAKFAAWQRSESKRAKNHTLLSGFVCMICYQSLDTQMLTFYRQAKMSETLSTGKVDLGHWYHEKVKMNVDIADCSSTSCQVNCQLPNQRDDTATYSKRVEHTKPV